MVFHPLEQQEFHYYYDKFLCLLFMKIVDIMYYHYIFFLRVVRSLVVLFALVSDSYFFNSDGYGVLILMLDAM